MLTYLETFRQEAQDHVCPGVQTTPGFLALRRNRKMSRFLSEPSWRPIEITGPDGVGAAARSLLCGPAPIWQKPVQRELTWRDALGFSMVTQTFGSSCD